MYCSQCGKKLKDTMLFCPNCGVAIEFPEDDPVETAPEKPVEAPVQAVREDEGCLRETEIKAPAEVQVEETKIESQPVPEESLDAPEKADEEDMIAFDEMDAPAPRVWKTPEMPPIQHENRQIKQISLFDNGAGEEDGEAPEEVLSFEPEREAICEFTPLELEPESEFEKWQKRTPEIERRPPTMQRKAGEGPRLEGHAPKMARPKPDNGSQRTPGQPQANRSARTYVPEKAVNPDDLFMDAEDPYDDYDDEDIRYADDSEDAFIYEDEESPSFLLRHIRGVMGLSLTALLAIVCLIYVCSSTGQEALAKMNLAWNPEVYSRIAYEYYEDGLYDMSGSFYEKALSRDPDNYSYAISAASAYIYGENTDKAASMLKRSISLDATRVEPYIYLMNLYPDGATRPWDVSQILQQGYGMTGDERLKSVAQ